MVANPIRREIRVERTKLKVLQRSAGFGPVNVAEPESLLGSP